MTKESQLSEFKSFIRLSGNAPNLREFIDLTALELREWVESKWQEGMNWTNYGSLWVVDHIVPFRFFDLQNVEHLKLCWNYKNLMPLYLKDNEKKNGNVYMAFILLYQIKGNDYYYNKLFDMLHSEVEIMDKYIEIYCKNNTLYV